MTGFEYRAHRDDKAWVVRLTIHSPFGKVVKKISQQFASRSEAVDYANAMNDFI